jgi:hypothetical protein
MSRPMRKRRNVAAGLIAALLGIGTLAAIAALVTFNDRPAFVAAIGGATATEPSPGPDTVSIGPITISNMISNPAVPATDLYFGGPVWRGWLPDVEVALNDSENIDSLSITSTALRIDFVEPRNDGSVRSAVPMGALGFDFSGPRNNGSGRNTVIGVLGFDFSATRNDGSVNGSNVGSTFGRTRLNEPGLLGAFLFNTPGHGPASVGVASNVPFDGVEIRELIGHLENEPLDQIVTAQPLVPPLAKLPNQSSGALSFEQSLVPEPIGSSISAVPEPPSVALVAVGALAFLWSRYRARARVMPARLRNNRYT